MAHPVTLTSLWGANIWLMEKSLANLTPEQWRTEVQGASSPLWILGHCLHSRYYTGEQMGMTVPDYDALDKAFTGGTKSADVPDSYTGEALLAEFKAFHPTFLEHLETLTLETLAATLEEAPPFVEKTKQGVLHFFYFHECYHVGQLGMLRRQQGLGSWMENMRDDAASAKAAEEPTE